MCARIDRWTRFWIVIVPVHCQTCRLNDSTITFAFADWDSPFFFFFISLKNKALIRLILNVPFVLIINLSGVVTWFSCILLFASLNNKLRFSIKNVYVWVCTKYGAFSCHVEIAELLKNCRVLAGLLNAANRTAFFLYISISISSYFAVSRNHRLKRSRKMLQWFFVFVTVVVSKFYQIFNETNDIATMQTKILDWRNRRTIAIVWVECV